MNIKYTKRFKNNYEKAIKAGFSEKIDELLNIVKNNPFEDYPPFKKLKCLENSYSRRINKQHRLVYVIREDHILFDRCWGHYDD